MSKDETWLDALVTQERINGLQRYMSLISTITNHQAEKVLRKLLKAGIQYHDIITVLDEVICS